ncbi:FtsX-like permease family protein [Pseudofrankia sp. DC12]|uniref:ABC transporter permease n=1 Tax=Pseudofrankia sp. DC12 TaxID=683315 RepID=UPI0005F77DDE|nr:FtsX-like permease family protein [Pseudofrankia sp. DC12]
MRTVLLLALAGLRGRSRTGIAITVLILALSALGLSIGFAVSGQGDKAIDRLAARTNVADVVVWADDSTLDKPGQAATGSVIPPPSAVTAELRRVPGVRTVVGPLPFLDTTLVVPASQDAADGSPAEYHSEVTTLADPNVAVNHPALVAGRWLAGSHEVVLERSVAADLGLHPGDHLALRGPGGDIPFTVAGAANELTDCGFPQCGQARLWISAAGLARIGPAGGVTYWIEDVPGASAEVVASTVVAQLGPVVVGTNTWPSTRGDLVQVEQIFGKIVSAFGLFLLVAVGVIVAGSMTSRMVTRRREMALFGAVGVRPVQLTAALLVEHLVLGVVAAALGWAAAEALAPNVDIGAAVTGRPAPHWAVHDLLVSGGALLLLLTLATVAGALRAGRASVVDALRDAPAAGQRGGALARLTGLVPGRLAYLGVGRLAARPVRGALTALTVLVAVSGAVVSGGWHLTVAHALTNPAASGDPWRVMVGRGNVPTATVEAALNQTPGISGWWSETERRGSDDDLTFRVRAIGGPQAPGYRVGAGRLPAGPGEAAVGYGLLDKLGLRVGQTTTVDIGGVDHHVHIVGWYRTTEDTGQILVMPASDLGPGAEPSQYRMTLTPGTSTATVRDALARRLGNEAEISTQSSSITGRAVIESVTTAIMLMLALVALTNMLYSLVASNRENARDIGVTGALGATPRQIVAQGAVAALFLATLALVIGVPVGLLVFRLQVDAVSASIGLGPGIGLLPSATFLIGIVLGTLVLTGATGAVAARGLARRPVGDLLRWE